MSTRTMMGAAVAAARDGNRERALELLIEVLAQLDSDTPGDLGSEFIVLFEWAQLAEVFPPARDALLAARDRQADKLLAGDDVFGPRTVPFPRSRFMLVAHLDDRLGQLRGTYELFLQLSRSHPDLAQRYAFRALPAIVAVGDFTLAARYLPEPLQRLDELNELAVRLPLYPSGRVPPRLGAELSNYMEDVRLCAAILEGLGRAGDSRVLRAAALDGIASDELRLLALREERAPGSIVHAISEHKIALETGIFGPFPP